MRFVQFVTHGDDREVRSHGMYCKRYAQYEGHARSSINNEQWNVHALRAVLKGRGRLIDPAKFYNY
jgi:hypothetical protein